MYPPACRSRSRHRGLTLIELMVTVAIVALIGLIAIPSFSRYSANVRIRGVANEAMSDLQYARAEAVQRNRLVTVTYSATGYQITSPRAGGGGNDVLRNVTLPTGVSLTTGSDYVVVYDPVRATATITGGTPRFALSGAGAPIDVSVSVTGRAQMCTPSGSLSGVKSCG